jgi:hypothetical protein
MNNIIDRLIKSGKANTVEGVVVLTILFGDKLPSEVINNLVIIISSIYAIYKFYKKDNDVEAK